MPMGIELHQVLQKEYRTAATRYAQLLVQESVVYLGGRSFPLREAMLRDDSLLALFLARDAYLLTVRDSLKKQGGPLAQEIERNLRDDNVNLAIGEIWEIKPIRSAALGVAQEFTYRSLFNFFVALIKDLPAVRALVQPTSRPLRFTREHLSPGTAVHWPEVRAKVRTVGGGVTGFPQQTIFVTVLDALPGLVLYLRYDIPVGLVALTAEALRRLLNELAARLRQGFRKVVPIILFTLLAVLVVLLVIILIILIVKLGAALVAALGAAAAGLAALLLRLGVELPRLIDLIRRIVEDITPLRENYGLNVEGIKNSGDGQIRLRFTLAADTPPEAVPRTGVSVGMLRLDDMPLALLSGLEGIIAVATSLAAAIILDTLEPGGGQVQA
jgi:hypothetical protein